MLDIKLLNIKLDTLRNYIEYERKEGKRCDIVDMNLNFIQKMIDLELKREKNLEIFKLYEEHNIDLPEPIISSKKLKRSVI